MVRRAKAARTVIAATSKRVLSNTLVSLPVQRQAALACVDGVLFSAPGWWSAPTQRELRLLNAPRSRLLRALANVKPGPGGSDGCGAPNAAQKCLLVRLSCKRLDRSLLRLCESMEADHGERPL